MIYSSVSPSMCSVWVSQTPMIHGTVRTGSLSDSRIMLYTYRNQECGEEDGQDLSRESEGQGCHLVPRTH